MPPTFGKPAPTKTRFNDLVQFAAERGMRLERGSPEQDHGARSGYILWRNGLWKQFHTLDQVEAAIVSGRRR